MSLYNIDECLNMVEEIFHQSKGTTKNDERLKNRFYSILFMCKFYELIYDINILIKSNRYNSVPVLFRAALEVSIDIKNIGNSDKYIYKLAYTKAKKEKKRLEILERNKEYDATQDLKEQIEVYKSIEGSIPEDCRKEVNIYDKFKGIDQSELLYRIVYSKLCKETHSDMEEMERHFYKQKGGKHTFIYDVGTTDLDKKEFVDSIILTILETIVAVAKINKIDTLRYEKSLSEFLKHDGKTTT